MLQNKIRYFAAKRNGDAGQEFGVAYMIQSPPTGANCHAGPITFVEKDDRWLLINFVDRPHTLHGMMALDLYFSIRISNGWFLEVDHPYSQEAILWRLTSNSEEALI